MKILIVKTSAIGDVTHTLPVLNAIRAHFPAAHITWLVEEASAEIIEGHRAIDRVLVCKRKQWIKDFFRPARFKKFLWEILEFIKVLRDTHYDLVVDFQGLLKSGIWVFLSRGKQKVGFGPGMAHSECSYIFYNRKIPAVSMDYHAIDRELMLLRAIGITCDNIEFGFPVGKFHRQKIKNILKSFDIPNSEPIVAINPMARWDTKLWEIRKFAQVADWLSGRGFRVCFTGAGSDHYEIERIRSLMTHNAVNLAGKTSLKTLAALYENAVLLLTTDTGPMHIATAIGTPVVALFGPTAPWRTGPYGPGHQIIQVKSDCTPCFKRACTTRACMKDITVEMVINRLEKVL